MSAPDEFGGRIGLDVGKEDHFAGVLDDEGESLFARSAVDPRLHQAGGRDLIAYDRKRAEGKKHNAAVICLARRPSG